MKLLEIFFDLSVPDIDLPNLEHLYQSTNSAMDAGEPDCMVSTCLIHYLGKSRGRGSEPRRNYIFSHFIIKLYLFSNTHLKALLNISNHGV